MTHLESKSSEISKYKSEIEMYKHNIEKLTQIHHEVLDQKLTAERLNLDLQLKIDEIEQKEEGVDVIAFQKLETLLKR